MPDHTHHPSFGAAPPLKQSSRWTYSEHYPLVFLGRSGSGGLGLGCLGCGLWAIVASGFTDLWILRLGVAFLSLGWYGIRLWQILH